MGREAHDDVVLEVGNHFLTVEALLFVESARRFDLTPQCVDRSHEEIIPHPWIWRCEHTFGELESSTLTVMASGTRLSARARIGWNIVSSLLR